MTTEQVFVDTGGWFAVLAADDKFHHRAAPAYQALLDANAELVTSNYVIAEVVTLLRRHASWADFRNLVAKFRFIVEQGYVSLVNIGSRQDSPLHEAFLQWFERLPAERLSFTDCVSFEIMTRLDIHRAFAFDRHFEKAGFHIIPGIS